MLLLTTPTRLRLPLFRQNRADRLHRPRIRATLGKSTNPKRLQITKEGNIFNLLAYKQLIALRRCHLMTKYLFRRDNSLPSGLFLVRRVPRSLPFKEMNCISDGFEMWSDMNSWLLVLDNWSLLHQLITGQLMMKNKDMSSNKQNLNKSRRCRRQADLRTSQSKQLKENTDIGHRQGVSMKNKVNKEKSGWQWPNLQ